MLLALACLHLYPNVLLSLVDSLSTSLYYKLPSCSFLNPIHSSPSLFFLISTILGVFLVEFSVSTKSKVVEESAGGTNLDAKFRLVDADDSNVCLDHQAKHESHDSSLNKVISCPGYDTLSLQSCFTLFVSVFAKIHGPADF